MNGWNTKHLMSLLLYENKQQWHQVFGDIRWHQVLVCWEARKRGAFPSRALKLHVCVYYLRAHDPWSTGLLTTYLSRVVYFQSVAAQCLKHLSDTGRKKIFARMEKGNFHCISSLWTFFHLGLHHSLRRYTGLQFITVICWSIISVAITNVSPMNCAEEHIWFCLCVIYDSSYVDSVQQPREVDVPHGE